MNIINMDKAATQGFAENQRRLMVLFSDLSEVAYGDVEIDHQETAAACNRAAEEMAVKVFGIGDAEALRERTLQNLGVLRGISGATSKMGVLTVEVADMYSVVANAVSEYFRLRYEGALKAATDRDTTDKQ